MVHLFINRVHLFNIDPYEESKGYLSNKYEPIKDNVLSVEIIRYSRRKEKTLHLCPKCRKDFERFMDNE
jgi:hypothetical protein